MRRCQGFTLIEMLVVIVSVSVIIAILVPAISVAKSSVVNGQCLANLRDIAAASLVYEIDHGRLPIHVAERSTAPIFAPTIKAPGFDAREVYAPYMNVDRMGCPFLPGLNVSQTDAAAIHINYCLNAGYYGDYENGRWLPNRLWVHSDTPWAFDGHPMTVLAVDRSYLDTVSQLPKTRNIINHAGGADGFELLEMNNPQNRGEAWICDTDGQDVRAEHPLNAVFIDGSADTFRGDDPALIRIPDRHSVRQGRTNYLMPTR